MARLFNRAGMTTTTTGTGAVTLGSAVTTPKKYLSFADAGVANGIVVAYLIEDGVEFEFGIGTYASAGPSLTRDTVRKSSNAGAKINLSGLAQVYIDAGAEEVMDRVLLQTLTAANSPTLDFAGLGGFSHYTWEVQNIIPVSDADLYLRVSIAGTFQASNYIGMGNGAATTPATVLNLGINGTVLIDNSGSGVSGIIEGFGLTGTTNRKHFISKLFWEGASSQPFYYPVAGMYDGGNGAIDGVRFLMSTGNISSGIIRMYGWNF